MLRRSTKRMRGPRKLAVANGEGSSASMVNVHVASVPVQRPFQPSNVEPGSGVAMRVTVVPTASSKMQGTVFAGPTIAFEENASHSTFGSR